MLQFEVKGRTGYSGFQMLSIDGKDYVCKTTGLNGQPSVDAVTKQLTSCLAITKK